MPATTCKRVGKGCRNTKKMPSATPTRKKATRPAMNKKSPYKPSAKAVKAGKTKVKQLSTAKKLPSTRKSVTNIPTKTGNMQARLRAREWAKRELGQKKKLLDVSEAIMIDGDSEEEGLKSHIEHSGSKASAGMNGRTCAKRETLQQGMLDLDIENQSMKKADDAAASVVGIDTNEEDIFYDALEFLPTQHKVAVEDVSDDEDDEELRDLRSSRRNRAPGPGQWMEPVLLEPSGHSFSTWPMSDS